MAQENVGINITVGGNTEQALGSLKSQLRQATAEVQALSEKFGATSEQAVAAAKRASELKDAIGDSKNLIDAFNPDTKFKAFSQTLSSVAGGFAAVQGALGLLGAEGEDVQKTLAKVQSALALSQGLEQLGDLGDAFKNVKTVAIDAFKGIKAAIGSSGIGLLVLALGAIVAYWDEIKAAVSGVSVEQKKLTEETNKTLKAEQEKLSAIDSQDNILKLQGKS
jgi:ABC-type transporter Mla subunit MlaD